MGLTKEQIAQIQILRNFMENRDSGDKYDGTLTMAMRLADEFTEKTGIEAMVIRKKNKYDWVSKFYFDTYEYSGKIYYKTEVGDE